MLEQLKNLGYSEAKIKTLTKVDISRILQFEGPSLLAFVASLNALVLIALFQSAIPMRIPR